MGGKLGQDRRAAFQKDISEHLLKALDSSADTVIMTDAEARILYANQAALIQLNCTKEDLIGQTITNFWFHPNTFIQHILGELSAHHTWQGRLHHKTKNGKYFWEISTVSPVVDAAGQVTHFIKTGQVLENEDGKSTGPDQVDDNYKTILDLMSDGYLETDLKGDVTFLNKSAARIYQRSPDEMIGLNYKVYMSPVEAEKIKNSFNEVYRTGASDRIIDYEIIGNEGAVISCETITTLLYDSKGKPVGFGGVIREVTEKKQLIEQLTQSEESYRRVMELAPDAITITRVADGHYLEVNKAFCLQTGYSREEILGQTVNDINIYANQEDRVKIVDALRTEGRVSEMRVTFRHKDGSPLHDIVSARIIQFKGEDCILFVGTLINSLIEAQAALEESEKRSRIILEAAPDVICLTRIKDGMYIEANDAFYRRTGYTPEETIGYTALDLKIYADEKDRQNFIAALLEEGQVDGMEMLARYKDGMLSSQLWSGRMIEWEGEQCALVIAKEIDDLKKAQSKLRESEAKFREHLEAMVQERTRDLKEAQKELVKRERLSVLGQLTATVSHELRNPLGVIRSSNFYLKRKIKDLDEKINKHLGRIDEQVTLCDIIVSDLLEYTRGRPASIAKQSVLQWVEQIVEQMRETEDFHIGLEISHNLPSVPHDQDKMRRVVINLLGNAVQAVQARQETALKDNESYEPFVLLKIFQSDGGVHLQVSDNGIGMDEQTQKRAFEPLFTTRSRGTGIGLAIVSKIVSEHDGRIELETRQNKGTTLTIILPISIL